MKYLILLLFSTGLMAQKPIKEYHVRYDGFFKEIPNFSKFETDYYVPSRFEEQALCPVIVEHVYSYSTFRIDYQSRLIYTDFGTFRYLDYVKCGNEEVFSGFDFIPGIERYALLQVTIKNKDFLMSYEFNYPNWYWGQIRNHIID